MKFILLTHERELTKGTNTGRLVKELLKAETEIIVWKRKEPCEYLVSVLAAKKAVLLFPDADAEREQHRELVTIPNQKPLDSFEYVVIIDATWQEARKIFNRSHYLQQAEKFALAVDYQSEFRLRRNQIKGGLSTVECVIEVLKQSEKQALAEQLSEKFRCFNNVTS